MGTQLSTKGVGKIYYAEGEGFEPSERYKRPTVFKTAAIDRSANPPNSTG